jgi:hypothetical protein
MIILALLLAALGTADLVRARVGDAALPWMAVAGGSGVVVVGVIGTSLPWWCAAVGIAAVAGWTVATTPFASGAPGAGSGRAAAWAVRALALAVVVVFVAGPSLAEPSGWLTEWYGRLPYAALDDVAFTTFALAVGGVLFLFESANVIVRAALRATGSDATRSRDTAPIATTAPRARWWGRGAPVAATVELAPLRGGRFIGPLERIFLLTLALSGQFTAIAAVVAAKGIIRFPEISKDDVGGSKAEYFLVGSFASWGLVLAVAVGIHFSQLN